MSAGKTQRSYLKAIGLTQKGVPDGGQARLRLSHSWALPTGVGRGIFLGVNFQRVLRNAGMYPAESQDE